jgi:diamine N-acetyltransferase
VPQRSPDAGEIRRLYVRAAAQGRGIGQQLLAVALAWLDAQAMRPVHVGVWSGNLGAQRLYARYGFVRVGEYEFPVGRHRDREFILRRIATAAE